MEWFFAVIMCGRSWIRFKMDRSKLEIQARKLATIAHHEAGHAVAAFHVGMEAKPIKFISGDETKSHHIATPYFSDEDLDNLVWEGVTGDLQKRIENDAFISLVGPWAQKKYNPKGFRKTHAEGDYQAAMKLLSGVREDEEVLEHYVKMINLEARNFVQDKFKWKIICHLANALLNQPEMAADEVRNAIMGGY